MSFLETFWLKLHNAIIESEKLYATKNPRKIEAKKRKGMNQTDTKKKTNKKNRGRKHKKEWRRANKIEIEKFPKWSNVLELTPTEKTMPAKAKNGIVSSPQV